MRDPFWTGFTDELEKKAGLEPTAARAVAGRLKGLSRIGLWGLAAYGGYKGLQEALKAVDWMTWFPEGVQRRLRRRE